MKNAWHRKRKVYTEHEETLRLYESYTNMIYPQSRVTMPAPELKRILLAVAEEHGVTVDALRSDQRQRPLPEIRAEFCRRATALDKYSTTQIGNAINRDHTTVLFALGRNKRKPSYMRRLAAE